MKNKRKPKMLRLTVGSTTYQVRPLPGSKAARRPRPKLRNPLGEGRSGRSGG